MLTATATLPGVSGSVPTARRFVESALEGWGSADLGWTAAMVVSELAANCTLHASGSPFTVQVERRADGTVRLEVRDASARLPQQRSHSTTSTTGRGLRIVADLSTAWGVDVAGGEPGKTVWVELGRPGPDGASDDAEAHDDDDLDALLARLGEPEGPSARAADVPLLLAA